MPLPRLSFLRYQEEFSINLFLNDKEQTSFYRVVSYGEDKTVRLALSSVMPPIYVQQLRVVLHLPWNLINTPKRQKR
jgi:hypothetical protein